jgi:hypothetical protein
MECVKGWGLRIDWSMRGDSADRVIRVPGEASPLLPWPPDSDLPQRYRRAGAGTGADSGDGGGEDYDSDDSIGPAPAGAHAEGSAGPLASSLNRD